SLVLVPVLAVLVYQQLGSMDKVEEWLAMQDQQATEQGRAAEMAALAEQLRERLVANPDNAEGWAMLGRTYMSLEQYQEAAWAFERLAQQVRGQTGREATAWGLSAQARFFASRGEMTEEVSRAIENARELDADEVNSLGLLGIRAFGQENFEQAIAYWERIVEVAPSHPQLASIRQGIAAAYERLGRDMPVEESEQAVSDRGVSVRVELSEAFTGSVPADTTLFVYARRPGGSGAPLAIARATAGELPLQLRLDDQSAMAPDARISQADEVVVTARLSPAGSAMPQPGDWQGQTEQPLPVQPGGGDVTTLVIDKQLH
ncbi:MAG: tetratricopeptide repeat protein, partial [Marinobacter sp.]|uniref:tetratricopeptide repeat protein n=1 Tax=Marinobacter sp. TaxID=50741 RepID=UPI00299D5CF0